MKRVAIQGIKTSFHHVAAMKHFGKDLKMVPCSTFRETCEMLKNDEVDYAVMAIENTIAGCLLANFFLLKDYKLKVVGEVYLQIQMNLMVSKGVRLADVKTVQSHPIAIRQCSAFINSTLPNVEVLERKDTAGCAKDIADNKLMDTAAIANELAAKEFGLEIIEKRIETNKQNFTRFFILSKEREEVKSANKATMSIQLGHEIGSLATVLQIFANKNVNLTMIQSIPVIGSPNDYLFNIDVVWDKRSDYDEAIHEILRNVASLSILGEYKKQDLPKL